jgi:hypothetical protein
MNEVIEPADARIHSISLDAEPGPYGGTVEPLSEECQRCEGLGWIDDPTACGDPGHCSPQFPCPDCNPEGIDDV